MGRIAYVCMSDLHLGANTSLLTQLAENKPADVSAVTRALVAGLRTLLPDDGGPKPTLILLGDVLELALARDEDAATVFQRFAELVMPPGRELFGAIWYVPGNHDHHLWEGARETQYAAYVERREAADALEPPWHSTRMLRETDEHPPASPLLEGLLARARGSAAERLHLTATYPNLAIRRGDRCVTFHHGHLAESTYYLLSTLDHYGFNAKEPEMVWDLEADNFAWIDFLWSGLGRCGSAGEHVGYLFDHVQDERGRAELVDRLSRSLRETIRLSPVGWLERMADPCEEWGIHELLTWVAHLAERVGRLKFYGPDVDPARALAEGVRRYIERYVATQVRRECDGRLPGEMTFVFGHTHSPFVEAAVPIADGQAPWRVLNTGGWVHESAEWQPAVGASLVLVDEELTPLALELYREGVDFTQWRVRPREDAEQASAFFREVEDALEGDPEPWAAFVRETERALIAHRDRFRHG